MRAFLPWVFAAFVIALLLHQIAIDEILAALQRTNFLLFGVTVGAGAGTWFFLDALAYQSLFASEGTHLTPQTARSIRATTYLLAPIHWNIGQAAVAVRLKMLHGMPLIEGASRLLLYQMISGLALLILATIGLLLAPFLDWPKPLFALSPRLSQAFPLALALLIACFGLGLRYAQHRFELLDRLRKKPLLSAFGAISGQDLLSLTLLKCAYQGVFAAVFYFGLGAFGVDVPFALALIATPLIQIAGSLPIAPAGLGTQQAAMIYLFAGRMGEPDRAAAVAAFAFSFPLLLMLTRALIGLIYLPDLRRERNAQGDPSARASSAVSRPRSSVDTSSV